MMKIFSITLINYIFHKTTSKLKTELKNDVYMYICIYVFIRQLNCSMSKFSTQKLQP